MNKKLLAAAIAAAVVAAPAAFAESTVYGKFHASIDSNDYENGADNFAVRSRSSRLGFKGSEDLGGGLKAIYQVELTINVDGNESGEHGQDGGDGFGGQRNTFIGLSGGFGTFLVGRHDTPAKIAFYGAGNERLGDSIIDLNSGVAGVFTEVRADNAIAYVSPSFSGFTFTAAAIPGEECDDSGGGTRGPCDSNGDNASDGIADHWSVGLIYKGNGLRASIGYEELDNQATTTTLASAENVDREMLQIGASYTMNNFSVGAHWEDTDNAGFVEGTDYEAWAITGKATFGSNAISLVYTMSETDRDSGIDTDTDGWGIAAEHNFSKRTKVYAAYATNEEDTDGSDDLDDDVFSLGMIHNF